LKGELQVLLTKLRDYVRDIQGRAVDLISKSRAIDTDANDQLALVYHLTQQIPDTICGVVVQYIQSVTEQRQWLMDFRQLGAELIAEIEQGITAGVVPDELVSRSARLRREIELQTRHIPVPQPHDLYFPPYVEGLFVARDFARRLNTTGDAAFIYTDEQIIYGNVWRLKIYPNGNMNARMTHVSVFLELMRGPETKTSYHYRLELRSRDPTQRAIVREYRSDFVVNDSWGWNKTIPIDKVEKAGFLTPEGDLVLRMKVKPESYYQAYLDMQAALREEKRQYRELSAQPPDS
jgi:hypothetical protein